MDHSQEEGDEVAHDTHHVALVPAGREVSTTVKSGFEKVANHHNVHIKS